MRQILDQNFYNRSELENEILQCVGFWLYFFCSLSNFHVHQNRARFVNVLTYGVGSVSQVVLLG